MDTLGFKIRQKAIGFTLIPEIKDKEKIYLNYVAEHIDNVNKAWDEIKNRSDCMKVILSSTLPGRIDGNKDQFLSIMDSIIKVHDNSKFHDDEWDAYRKHFYPLDETEKKESEADFNAAWKHHYETNMHHWDFWYHANLVDDMTLMYVLEMCCDWIAMSIKFGGDALSWYEKEKKKIHLGKAQEEFVIRLLKVYYNK